MDMTLLDALARIAELEKENELLRARIPGTDKVSEAFRKQMIIRDERDVLRAALDKIVQDVNAIAMAVQKKG
jgi:cellulose biosynthesis protein BcsQ